MRRYRRTKRHLYRLRAQRQQIALFEQSRTPPQSSNQPEKCSQNGGQLALTTFAKRTIRPQMRLQIGQKMLGQCRRDHPHAVEVGHLEHMLFRSKRFDQYRVGPLEVSPTAITTMTGRTGDTIPVRTLERTSNVRFISKD